MADHGPSVEADLSTILIADDHPFVLQFLSDFCKKKWPDVAVVTASSLNEVLECVERVRPNIVIMDYAMPDGSALEVVRAIVLNDPDAKVILFSGAMSDSDAVEALRAGAVAYIPKDVGVDVFDRVAELVELGGTYAPSSVVKDLYEPAAKGAGLNDPAKLELSDRELELIGFFVEGMSNKVIAANLDMSVSAIKQAARGVFKKMNVKNRTQAAVVALQLGIVSERTEKE